MTTNRSFRVLLASHACSNLGDGIRRTAFPLLALTLTQDAVLVAGLSAALSLPWLVFGLHVGALADRLDRRRILVVSAAARAILLTLLAVAVLTGFASLAVLYLVAFVVGTTEVSFDSTAQAIIPATVGHGRLETANSRIAASEIIGNEAIGPPIGGALFALAVVAPFMSMAALALAAALLVPLMSGHFVPRRDRRAERRIASDIVEGLRFLAGHEVLRVVTVMAGVMAFVDTAGFAVLVLYADRILGLGEIGFGVLVALIGVGGVFGSLLSGRLAKGRGARRVVLAGASALTLSMAGLAVAETLLVAMVSVTLAGLGYGLWGVVSLTLRQRLTPDGLLARAGAGHRLLALGSAPIGALAGGVVAQVWGLRATYAAGAVVLLVTTVAGAVLLTPRRLEAAEARAAEAD